MSQNFIYGIRTVIEAINSGKTIEKVLFKKDLQGQNFNDLFKLVRESQIPFQFIPGDRLNRITQKNHQGVIAYISLIEHADIEEIIQSLYEEAKMPLILILDSVTDVRNFGSIARTAECAGVNAIVIKDKGSAQINSDAIKTSAGALYKIPVAKVSSLSNVVKYLKDSGLQIISATEKATEQIYDADYNKPTAIIMGAEDTGISPELLKLSDKKVKIPIVGEIQSLNVSNAASVVIYEALRQRLNL